jgi:hypothetical protein
MVFPDGSGDVLRLYRPVILPVHGPKDAETRDVLELRSVDARISHLRRVPLVVDCTMRERDEDAPHQVPASRSAAAARSASDQRVRRLEQTANAMLQRMNQT